MKQLRLCLRKGLTIYLCLALVLLGCLPSDLMAAAIPSDLADLESAGLQAGIDRAADLQKIRSVLESKLVAQRLTDLGLSVEEVQQAVASLTPDELHQVATKLDGLQAGGELGIIIGVLVIVVLVLLIIYLAKRT